jgi:putative tryptophan/tyrosine transport system substrate-binding protein
VCYSFGRKRTEGCPGGGAVTNRLLHKRREFITLLGGAAAMWPLVARAQKLERMRRVGVLMPYAANDPQVQERNAAFLQRLQQLGWTVGQNL